MCGEFRRAQTLAMVAMKATSILPTFARQSILIVGTVGPEDGNRERVKREQEIATPRRSKDSPFP